MNEEQLREIALLAEQLGFVSNSYCNNLVFIELTEKSYPIDIEDMRYYLFLCEIQWWINTKEHKITIIPFCDDKELFYYYWHIIGITCEEGSRYSHYSYALTAGIIKALKLIENENKHN